MPAPKKSATELFHKLDPFVLTAGQPASKQVYVYLRQEIIRGRILPDTPLSEANLCTYFGVSRQPVREALLRLSIEGLIHTYPQRGSVVTRISVPQVRRSQMVREAVEVETVTRAIGNYSDRFIARLDAELKLQSTFVECWDVARFYDSDQNFHRLICDQSGVTGIWDDLEGLRSQLDRARHVELQNRDSLQALIDQHQVIFQAIANKDVQEATVAMRAHLRRVTDMLQSSVELVPHFFSTDDIGANGA